MGLRETAVIITTNVTIITKPLSLSDLVVERMQALLNEPVQLGVGEVSPLGARVFNLASLRDQLTIILEPSRVLFNDSSGQQPGASKWVGKVHQALEILDTTSRMFGFNYDLEFSLGPGAASGEFIASRMLLPERVQALHAGDVGAGVRLQFAKASELHTLVIEPRSQQFGKDRVYAKLNLHHGEDIKFPDTEELKVRFEGGYDLFLNLVEALLDLH
jgi:hypothetical protein